MRATYAAALLAASPALCQQRFGPVKNEGRGHLKRQAKRPQALTDLESVLVNNFDNESIAEANYFYATRDHRAGFGLETAKYTQQRWSEAGWQTRLDTYNAFLNFPLNQSLVLNYADGTTFAPQLTEDALEEDPTTQADQLAPFHGYSASGEAEAEFVYVGRGQVADFERLVELGVDLEGKIALSRYGGPFRGLKVKNAQDYGCIAAVLFTDPADDGNITEANGYEAYPDGPARQPSSVQRGSVMFLSQYPGDPTTPGYPSREDSPRADTSNVRPTIPSVPISYPAAEPILAALDGFGTSGEEVGRDYWVGSLNASYFTGPAPGVTIQMSNLMNESYVDIYNAIGWINGTSQDETIILGNHRDAWTIGGSVDPNSGSATLVEIANAYGALLEQGWQPKRNIIICSWDAEEYGLVGSTEWVEEYFPWLSDTAYVYINLDSAASGPYPGISATPDLHQIGVDTMKKIEWPALSTGNASYTMYDAFMGSSDGEIGVLGSGSDYSPFLSFAGISSIDVGSSGGPDDAVYMYHSIYDSYHWQTTFGDTEFLACKGMGQYVALMLLSLSSDDFVPLNATNYAVEMEGYLEELQEVVDEYEDEIDLSEIADAIEVFRGQAGELEELTAEAMESGDEALTHVVNDKLRNFQRAFTSQGGLPERNFYRHVAFAPGLDTGYAPVIFPGPYEAVTMYENATMAREWVGKTAAAILAAGEVLKK